ncbi:MAG: DNA polymerase IV, partial [Oscillospiraceae bacterium]
PAHHEKYSHFSKLINAIYGRYTDLVEPFGIDESWLDVTGTLHLFGGDGGALADEIRATVHRELGLTLSVGVSFNKIFAKLGSDYKKPDATTVIDRAHWQKIVWPLPVGDLLFVGKASLALFGKYDIRTIGDLAHFDRAALVALLGKQGDLLYEYSNGLEQSPVASQEAYEPPKSVGNGTTFPRNLLGEDDIRRGLASLTDSVAMRLRRCGLKCTTLQVTIRDPQFHDICRQRRLETPTYLARDLSTVAMEIVKASWNLKSPIRALTVTGQNLVPEDGERRQASLFGEESAPQRKKVETLEQTVDTIRARFGTESVGYVASQEHIEKASEKN